MSYSTLAALDFEATGTDPLTARPVSVALVIDGNHKLSSLEVCEVMDAGVEIPEEASKVHGITRELLERTDAKSSLEVIMSVIDSLRIIQSCNIPLVIFNACYDWPLLQMEAKRYALDFDFDSVAIIDPMIIDRSLDKYRRGKRTLTDVCAHYNVALDQAHDARFDCIGAIGVARALLKQYKLESRNPYSLHEDQIGMHGDWVKGVNDYWKKNRIDKSIRGIWPDGELYYDERSAA